MDSILSFLGTNVAASIINIIGMIVIPFSLFQITNRIQEKEQKRNDKMALFRTLMTYRDLGWTKETVQALNMIDIVFADNEDVRLAWEKYYECLCKDTPTPEQLDAIKEARHNMLYEMASVLGYKEDILWDAIRKPYLPKGLTEEMQQEQSYKSMTLKLLGTLTQSTPPIFIPSTQQQPQNASEHYSQVLPSSDQSVSKETDSDC